MQLKLLYKVLFLHIVFQADAMQLRSKGLIPENHLNSLIESECFFLLERILDF